MHTAHQPGHVTLVASLADRGLPAPHWRKIFDAVPRERFIPDRIWCQRAERCEPITSPEERSALIYSDEPVVTQIDDGTDDGPGVATSSNSQPSMVAKMLGLLQAEDGNRVLEIGTATGYVAALLCERLGGDSVHSIEIDPALAERAAATLRAVGYAPHLLCGDGEDGWPDTDPFDRLIATCALRYIPHRLVKQVRPGGIIVAPLTRNFWSGALVQLTVQDDGSASGTFCGGASYMPMRSHRTAPGAPVDESTARARRAGPDPALLLTLGFAIYAGTRLPDVTLWDSAENGQVQVWVSRPDGAGATAATGEDVWQYGPGNLWEDIEQAYLAYQALGRPETDQFGLTVTSSGQQVWLRDPQKIITPAR